VSQEAKTSLPGHYFDEIYARERDPWHFETKPYEHAKYASTLANLPRPCYATALEVGCSIGVLTQQLAARCDRLLALDAAQAAVDVARERCADLPQVEITRATLPDEFPEGSFDLILLSEVGYYFDLPDLKRVQSKLLAALNPGGDLVLVHYLPFVPDYPLTGDEVHEAFLAMEGVQHLNGFRAERYRFDAWRKA
jgi:trans-aconitate methyltransferase